MNETRSHKQTADFSIYVDLENARNAIIAASTELIRGNEHAAQMILIDWLAVDRGQK